MRWPADFAVLLVIALTVLMPDEVRMGPPWLMPTLEGLVLLVLVVQDPGRLTRSTKLILATSVTLVALIAFDAGWASVVLVKGMIEGSTFTKSANHLLAAGAAVAIMNTVAFTLLYWELDGGGPAARATRPRCCPSFAFPQDLTPEIAPPGWRPHFVDYLYLGITNASAFSPTDVMPLAHWGKIAMAVQATISFSVVALVVARAVNAFP